MNRSDLDPFLGVWRATPGAPRSDHTFTWRWDGAELLGEWVVEMPDSPAKLAVEQAGKPTRFDMPVGRAWLEDGVVLFKPHEHAPTWEFRLSEDDQKAVVGAAVHKLERAVSPNLARSIEGHRVMLHRDNPPSNG